MSKRQRGVVLTERGKERLETAIATAQETEKYGKGFTQEGLSERAKLGIKTIKKIRAQIPADKTSVQTLFKAFDLELEAADYGLPEPAVEQSPPLPSAPRQPHLDWAEVPDASIFYGRETELATLEQWIVADRCRLVALLGMGGIGKTSIAAKVSRHVRQDFDYVIWRSLREAPPLEKILLDCIKFFSDQRDLDLPESPSEAATKLVRYFQQSRCLLVLDNAESILQAGTQAGQYRPGYEGYGTLLQRVGESQHQSCLLLTSREQPPEVVRLKGRNRPVRSHPLHGLDEQAGEEFLRAEGLAAADTEWKQVFNTYSGNPLALKIVANSIQDLFAGNIAEFLQQGTGIFGDIRDLLEQQFERLSQREQTVMYWLTINRKPTSIAALQEDILEPISTHELMEALESLRRRSLVERTEEGFTLQNVVMEYLTDRFVSLVVEELQAQNFDLFHRHALMQATAKDYVRESQIRLILHPIAVQFVDLDQLLTTTLKTIRQKATLVSGYAPGNLLNFFCQLEICLGQTDFSNLALRHNYLKNAKLQGINFSNSQFFKPTLPYAFGMITSVAFSPTETSLVTGDSGGEIRLWCVVTGQLLKTFQAHADWISSVTFSPSGQNLASSSEDATVRLWDIETGECIHKFQAHTNWVNSVAFSPDGKTLASGGDTIVRLWDIETGECIHKFQAHTNWVNSVAFSPDGKTLASGSSDTTVRLWDIETGRCLNCFQGHTYSIHSVAFSPDGKTLASGSSDTTVRLWDIETGRCLNCFQGHTYSIRSVAFSPDGKTLASGSADSTVRLWNARTGKCVSHIKKQHTHWIRSVAFSPDGKTLASGGDDATVCLWNMSADRCVHRFQGYLSWVSSIALSPDGKNLASGNYNSTICLWNIYTGQRLHIFQKHTKWVHSVAFSPDGKTLASGSSDATICLWDTRTGQCIYCFQGDRRSVSTVIFSPDGKILVSGGSDASIKLWDAVSLECISRFRGHTHPIRSIDFSPDGKNLLSGSHDGTMKLWSLNSDNCIQSFRGHEGWVRSVVFSPDGKMLVSGSSDKTVRFWEVSTGNCIDSFQVSSWVRSVAFSPDGKMLAVAGDGTTVGIWDLTTRQYIQAFLGTNSLVSAVAFNSDGKILVSGGEDGSIHLWSVQTGQCIAVLRSPRPYEGTNITGATGLTEAQRASMLALGAVDEGMEEF